MIVNPYLVIPGVSYDPDAQAFITATAISGSNANAINELVLDLKAASIWTKFNALYPIIGGTATTHKYNLKNPLDTDAAFRLTFATGVTHSSTGMVGNGTSGYANTQMPFNTMGLSSHHLSFYSRTNLTSQNTFELGCGDNVSNASALILSYGGGLGALSRIGQSFATVYTPTRTDIFSIVSSTTSNNSKVYENGVYKGQNTGTQTTLGNRYYYILAANQNASNTNNGTPLFYSTRQCAFASIGSGLTDTESQLFYQIVEKYQVALGRNINPTQSFYYNRNYNNETNAFLFATQITDTTQQTAVNTLVNDFKSAGIWTKMRAVYPIVGGTAATHAVNLSAPGTYNLTFATGWTHASTGMTPNGSSSYADTSFIPSVNGTLNSSHISYYSRTNSASNGQTLSANNALGTAGGTSMYLKTISAGSFYGNVDVYPNVLADYAGGLNADTRGFYITSRTASNSQKGYKNGGIIGTSTSSGNRTNRSLFLAATNKDNPVQVTEYGIYQCAFASIGDGLSDTEAANFYTAVQAYQTTLGRQV